MMFTSAARNVEAAASSPTSPDEGVGEGAGTGAAADGAGATGDGGIATFFLGADDAVVSVTGGSAGREMVGIENPDPTAIVDDAVCTTAVGAYETVTLPEKATRMAPRARAAAMPR